MESQMTLAQEIPHIEELVHNEFGETKPSEDELVRFLQTKNLPRNEIATIALCVSIAGLVLAGWRAYVDMRDRNNKKPPLCPEDGLPEVRILDTGESVCRNGHKWRAV